MKAQTRYISYTTRQHSTLQPNFTAELTNIEALTVLCSVVKHAGSITLFPEEKARRRKVIKCFSSSDDPRRVIPVDLHSFLWHENVVTSHNCRTQKLAFLVARRFWFNQVPIDFGWVPTKFHFMWWADFSFNDYFLLGVLVDTLVFG